MLAIALVTTTQGTVASRAAPNTKLWSAAASMPTARRGLSAAEGVDGYVYAIGGEGKGHTVGQTYYDGRILSTVEAYNPKSGTWTTEAPMRTPRSFLAAAAGRDGRIYAIGGRGKHGDLNTVEAYNPRVHTWSTVASMPTAREGLAAATGSDGHIYAIGGLDSNGRILHTVEAYDPAGNSWTAAASMPTARETLGAVTGPDGRIYAIGGSTSRGDLNTVEVYASAINSWSTAAPMPAARDGLAVATGADGRIYVIGGIDSGFVTDEVEAYTPQTNTWSFVAPLLTARDDLAAALGSDRRIYAIGGFFRVPVNAVQVYPSRVKPNSGKRVKPHTPPRPTAHEPTRLVFTFDQLSILDPEGRPHYRFSPGAPLYASGSYAVRHAHGRVAVSIVQRYQYWSATRHSWTSGRFPLRTTAHATNGSNTFELPYMVPTSLPRDIISIRITDALTVRSQARSRSAILSVKH